MAPIPWRTLTQPEFDRHVEAVCVLYNADLGDEAFAVNGRGGDAGIDIHIRRDDRLTIVQLKFFPEGFSNGFKPREKQIRSSFKTALQHNPDEWHLVVPGTLTSGERRFVTGLSKGTAGPKIRIVDQTLLDILCSGVPELVDYFEKDQLYAAAVAYGQEKALLTDMRQLAARVAGLAERAATLDPDWGVEFVGGGREAGMRLFAKHPRAAEVSPIHLHFDLKFGKSDEAIRGAFLRLTEFGSSERIDLPASVVAKFRVDGPAFVAHESTNVELTLEPISTLEPGLPFRVSVLNASGRRAGSWQGVTKWGSAGSKGASFSVEFLEGALSLDFTFHHDRARGAAARMHLAVAGREPDVAVRAIDQLLRLGAAENLELELEGNVVGTLRHDGKGSAGFDLEALGRLRAVAEDLRVVQEATSTYFSLPEDVPLDDRLDLRCLRLMLEGKAVVLPRFNQFTPTLSGEDSAAIRAVLTEESTLTFEQDEGSFPLFGQDIPLGPVKYYMPRARAVEGAQAVKALDAGTAAGTQVKVRAVKGYGIWMWLPDLLNVGPDDHIRPVSLGLPGLVDDAPDIKRARAS